LAQINSSIIKTVPIAMVNTDVAAFLDTEDIPVHEDVLSTGESTPSVLKAMILGFESGPAEIDHLFVVPVADNNLVAVGSGDEFQEDSFESDYSDGSSGAYEPPDAIQEHIADDFGYYLDNFIENTLHPTILQQAQSPEQNHQS
jgi:hypothetical protein